MNLLLQLAFGKLRVPAGCQTQRFQFAGESLNY
jgi:hypothetical protein